MEDKINDIRGEMKARLNFLEARFQEKFAMIDERLALIDSTMVETTETMDDKKTRKVVESIENEKRKNRVEQERAYEAAEHVVEQRLNLSFVSQAFLFGAQAVTAQTVQGVEMVEGEDNDQIDYVVQCLRFTLPLLGIFLSFMSFLILWPMFGLQHELHVKFRYLLVQVHSWRQRDTCKEPERNSDAALIASIVKFFFHSAPSGSQR